MKALGKMTLYAHIFIKCSFILEKNPDDMVIENV